MANPAINFAGFLYNDGGTAVSGATVNLYDKNSVTPERATTTTDSNGAWSITHTTAGEFDIEIVSGASFRRIKFDDKVHLSELDAETINIRANEGGDAPLYFFADEGDDAGDRWLFKNAAGGVFTIGNDINSQGTYVAHVTITPHATVASSTFAIAGLATIAGKLTLSDGFAVGSDANGDVLYSNGTKYIRLARGTDGDVLTLASSVPSWSTPTTGDITGVTAGAGLTGGGTTSTVTLNVIGGNGITANADDVAITAAQTTVTSIYNSALILGGDAETSIDFGTSNEIDFKADNAARLTLTASALYPVTNNQIDLGTASLEFADAFFDGTVTADAFAGPLTGTASNATTVTNAAITFAKMQNVAANSILGRNANSSGVLSEVALANANILIGDGTGFTAAALSGDATMANDGAVTITAAQTGITSVYNASLKMGRDSQNLIDFATTDNKVILRVNNVDEVELVADALEPVTNDGVALGTTSLGWSDLHLATLGVINWANGEMTITEGDANTLTVAGGTFATAALTATTFAPTDDITMTADKSLNLPQGANIKFTDAITQDSIDDDDHQGIIMTFTAGSTVRQYSPVYIGTDDEVHECDADAIATMPCIGVSVNTSDVTDGNPIEVMLLGLIRNEDFTDFGTNGAPVYVSATVGTMTNTAPSGTDDVVQVIGHSVGEKLLFVQPCLTTIEHA